MSLAPYLVNLAIFIGIYAILAISLNLAIGYTGLLNLGHIAFFGVGAYTSALLTIAGVPFIFAIIASGLVASGFGYLLVLGTHKLKGDYLALATLGFNFVMVAVFLNWKSLTRGPLGIPGIPKPEILGISFASNWAFLFLVVIIAGLVYFAIARVVKSPYGTLLGAIRDDELGTKVLGKNTFKMKREAMMMSAFFAGIAGSLFAHYITFIDPTSFGLHEIILILTIVIVGGLASLKGSLIGTIVILLIPEILRFFEMPASVIGPLRQIIYVVILVLILLYRPRGIFGKVDME
jgi:branched-chain amino acid transport system permease protein